MAPIRKKEVDDGSRKTIKNLIIPSCKGEKVKLVMWNSLCSSILYKVRQKLKRFLQISRTSPKTL